MAMDNADFGRQLIEFVGSGDVESARNLIEAEKSEIIDFADDDGMSVLMHAAYKGDVEMCRYLLEKGADVNTTRHTHQYTSLMFAALSGSAEVTQLLLEAGAVRDKENDIGKTASQLAGFVGHHQCVSVITNFISQSVLKPFTVPQGLETEPKLPHHLMPAVYELIMSTNLNPVHLSLYLSENSELLDIGASLVNVLEKLLELFVKEMNEPFALKMHFLTHVVCQASRHADDPTKWIKCLLKGREADGVLLNMEDFVRTSIRDLKYRDSVLLKTLMKNISAVTPGEPPSALCCLEQAVNNSREADYTDRCFACGAKVPQLKRCSACKEVSYCSAKCQKLHWFSHKKQCKNGRKASKQQDLVVVHVD